MNVSLQLYIAENNKLKKIKLKTEVKLHLLSCACGTFWILNE